MSNLGLLTVSDICRAHHFKKRGKAFFRACGDGVLQVLKYSSRSAPFHQEIIDVGLFSLYGELQPQWFTSSGCIPNYNALYLKTPHWQYMNRFMQAPVKGAHVADGVLSFTLEASLLEHYIFPFLDAIQDQQGILDGILYLDRCSRMKEPSGTDHDIRWTDMLRFAPFLKCNQLDSAQRIIECLLNLHMRGEEQRRQTCSDAELKAYLESNADAVAELKRKLAMVSNQDEAAIQEYLETNYALNSKLAGFCLYQA